MPNVAAVLKEEIRRLAKKEVKAMVGGTKQAVARYRGDIVQLKKMLDQQEREIKRLQKQVEQQGQVPVDEESSEDVRFSARSVKAQRARLGLSAADYGKLVGVSPLTIYHWEKGESRPRKAQLDALVAVRGIGKREALAKLADLDVKKPKKAGR